MVHGAIENGRIFYTESGKGLACFLARHGYQVYVADLRGRGLSTPAIAEQAEHGQHELITEDMPALHRWIAARHAGFKLHWMAHSWGGVIMASTLVRFPSWRSRWPVWCSLAPSVACRYKIRSAGSKWI